MSSVYELEPPTEGKVLLTTTHGEIEIELWAKECPKACRNFVGLCLEGYYDGDWAPHHQGLHDPDRDPTGTAAAGFLTARRSRTSSTAASSSTTAGGRDGEQRGQGHEPEPVLHHARAVRLDRPQAHHLRKVAGHTIYNALQIAEMETEGDRPVEPHPKILKTEVLWNPFDDIVPRHADEPLADDAADADAGAKKKKQKKNSTS